MKLKVLIVPTLIIVALFILINFIKPDYDTYKEQVSQRDAARYDAENINLAVQNVTKLSGELTGRTSEKNFIDKYVPNEKDDARVLDSMNFLTTQSGLIASNISLQKSTEQMAAATPVLAVPVDEVATGEGAPLAITNVYQAPKAKSYQAVLEAYGNYENLKDLLNRLRSSSRFSRIDSVVIEDGVVNAGEEGAPVSGEVLKLTFTADMPYIPLQEVASGRDLVNVPVFQTGSLPLNELTSLQGRVQNAVPDIVLGSQGKENPFR